MYYDGHYNHAVHLHVYNKDTTVWDQFGSNFIDEATFGLKNFDVPDDTSYIDTGGVVKVWIDHPAEGKKRRTTSSSIG